MSEESFSLVTGSAQIITVLGTIALVAREALKWHAKRRDDTHVDVEKQATEVSEILDQMHKLKKRVKKISGRVLALADKEGISTPSSV